MKDTSPDRKTYRRYDRNLRSIRDIHEKIAYVQDNPIRRGLVQQASAGSTSHFACPRRGLRGHGTRPRVIESLRE